MRQFLPTALCLVAVAGSVLVSGCRKDETDNLSRIKSYPALSVKGNEYYVINVGETFNDPGAVASLAGSSVTPIISGAPDINTPGIYRILYKAANTEGDTVSQGRTVIVTSPAVNSLDQSGVFKRGAFADSPVTKVGNKGLYKIDNFGFTNAPNLFPAYFVQITPTRIVVPSQTIPGLGFTNFVSVASVFTAGRLTTITYGIQAPAVFGAAPRSAVRQ